MTDRKKADNELMSMFLSGDEKAFKTLFDRYYKGLLNFAYSYCRDTYFAENIVQEAFILLWEKSGELDIDSNIHAFMIKVVQLKIWNHIEKQRRRVAIERGIFDDMVRELDLKLYTLDSLNTSAIYISEIETIIENAIQQLPPQTQAVFRMSRNELLTNKEIAQTLRLSEKSIEYHITKVLRRLKVELADYIKIVLWIHGL